MAPVDGTDDRLGGSPITHRSPRIPATNACSSLLGLHHPPKHPQSTGRAKAVTQAANAINSAHLRLTVRHRRDRRPEHINSSAAMAQGDQACGNLTRPVPPGGSSLLAAAPKRIKNTSATAADEQVCDGHRIELPRSARCTKITPVHSHVVREDVNFSADRFVARGLQLERVGPVRE